MTAPEHHWLRHSKVDSEVDKRVIAAEQMYYPKQDTEDVVGSEDSSSIAFITYRKGLSMLQYGYTASQAVLLRNAGKDLRTGL